MEPLPPSAIQQQPGATVPTQRQGNLRSTAQPQLPQQPLPPETALHQTSVRLPQQPVSTVVTRLSQPSGPNTAARIVQLPTQPIPQNTVSKKLYLMLLRLNIMYRNVNLFAEHILIIVV